jgi:hypothetical protein
MTPTLTALAKLQAGTSDTPIHDQLVVQHAVRQLQRDLADGLGISLRQAMEGLTRAMEQTGRHVAAFTARFRDAQAAEAAWRTPEATLDRIRSDQASLEWHDSWRADR